MSGFYQLSRVSYNNFKRMTGYLYRYVADRSAKILILVYHRVLPIVRADPFNMTVSLKTFKRQIDAMAKKYPVISLSEAVKQRSLGAAKSKTQIVLTFDDGYQDNYEFIYPILKREGLPASFFVPCGYVDSNRPLWHCELFNLLYNNSLVRKIKIADKIISQGLMQPRRFFIFSAIDAAKSLNSKDREELLGLLKGKLNNKKPVDDASERLMTWGQLREMARSGMEVGAHGFTHSSLARIPIGEAEEEIKKCKEAIENNLKKECAHFAFPFGSKMDYNQRLVGYLKQSGFQSSLLNIQGYNHIEKDAFCFKRIIIEETVNLEYLLGR